MSLNWWMLYFAIAFEVFGTSCLKLSEGLSRWGFFAFALGLYAVSFVFLAAALRHIPVSVAYALWSGLGTVLVVLVGWFWFGEPMSGLRGLFIAMIVVGAVGLNVVATDS
jgi:small multidrug resistance pump